MVNDLPPQYLDEELDRNAFNAAFNELGLRWYWDCVTYVELLRQRADAPARIRHYLESQQPHLLRAYDAEFLCGVIQDKAAEHRQRLSQAGIAGAAHFNWAETLGRELGI
ncbi:hypothetical protein [Variovorax sp. OV329]|uniref:hypothetical protein n=1 Tax=Variovorax sp. OV329 TaxID=1882825 RepID=UPI0008E1AC78|nr:hypothetical protein [Variovorax sp. OV329]SFM86843.1 hypothetical protein SAMN05444747_11056 [Variovorax sp. OV329]